jgi:hypothetical protein
MLYNLKNNLFMASMVMLDVKFSIYLIYLLYDISNLLKIIFIIIINIIKY